VSAARRFTTTIVVVATLLAGAILAGAPVASAEPTGHALPGLEPYDEFMTALIRKWDVTGGALAVARDDKLLLARGYGLANRDRQAPVEPTSLFRLCSLSKTITAVAILQLVQGGRLRLDDKVLPILGAAGPRVARISDPRVSDITVRHLLQHSGGFDRARSGDVVFMPGAAEAARRQNGPLPPDCPTILRDTLERKLDFAPGERFAYSNIGYCMLGRVVERVTGTAYEAYVRGRVLAPAGATALRLGRTLETAEGEVTYYDYRGATSAKAMAGFAFAQAPRPYGTFALETMDSYGGWIGAPVDYLRFVLAIDGRRGSALLDAATLAQMHGPVGPPATASDEEGNVEGSSYGLGIRVRKVRNGHNLWHTGSLPGSQTLAVRTADGFAWVVAFNGRPRDRSGFLRDLDRGLWTAKNAVKAWPDGDLFTPRP
jgi:N-acyl-D-amino-acid deacylase